LPLESAAQAMPAGWFLLRTDCVPASYKSGTSSSKLTPWFPLVDAPKGLLASVSGSVNAQHGTAGSPGSTCTPHPWQHCKGVQKLNKMKAPGRKNRQPPKRQQRRGLACLHAATLCFNL
jgi:hypothetical protein